MEPEKVLVKPSLRYQIFRMIVVIIGFYYAIEALFKIPKRGIYVFELWVPKNEWARMHMMGLLKTNISAEILQKLIYSIMIILTAYALYYILKTLTTSFSLNYKYIEYSHGVVVRSQDTVDMVVVKDQELKQGLYERILGLATITVMSTDITHPVLKMMGLPKKEADEALEFLRLYSSRSIVDYRMTQDMKRSKGKMRQIEDDQDGEGPN